MGARDSDDDIRKYLPDFRTIMQEADPARAEQKLKDALDNPELDQALAEMKHGMKEGETPFAFPAAAAPATPPEAPSAAPSPWEKAGAASAEAIDKAALPSASAPKTAAPKAVAPAVARTVAPPISPREGKRKVFVLRGPGALPVWLKSALAVLAVVGPMMMVAIVLKTPKPAEVTLDAAASARVAPPATVVSAAAPPLLTAIPSESAALPAPAVSAVPSVEPSGAAPVLNKARPGGKQRGAVDDPHKDAGSPSPPQTAESVAPPPPPPPPPHSTSTTPFEDKPVF